MSKTKTTPTAAPEAPAPVPAGAAPAAPAWTPEQQRFIDETNADIAEVRRAMEAAAIPLAAHQRAAEAFKRVVGKIRIPGAPAAPAE
jgi:hypothetical protein